MLDREKRCLQRRKPVFTLLALLRLCVIPYDLILAGPFALKYMQVCPLLLPGLSNMYVPMSDV